MITQTQKYKPNATLLRLFLFALVFQFAFCDNDSLKSADNRAEVLSVKKLHTKAIKAKSPEYLFGNAKKGKSFLLVDISDAIHISTRDKLSRIAELNDNLADLESSDGTHSSSKLGYRSFSQTFQEQKFSARKENQTSGQSNEAQSHVDKFVPHIAIGRRKRKRRNRKRKKTKKSKKRRKKRKNRKSKLRSNGKPRATLVCCKRKKVPWLCIAPCMVKKKPRGRLRTKCSRHTKNILHCVKRRG